MKKDDTIIVLQKNRALGCPIISGLTINRTGPHLTAPGRTRPHRTMFYINSCLLSTSTD